eukprot:TRINITY_DN273_c0_g1_i1.p1 TRINITY_DN273_c0_g1~~TRINITY_DN273_c0_g1_i1.p1  ORF type:complete len:205 (+),score=43.29 TRINITY_DN273_c0_g1_i1:70-684(+)
MAEKNHVDTLKEGLEAAKKFGAEVDGWTQSHDANGVIGAWKTITGSSISCYRATGTVNAPPEKVIDELWGRREAEWKKYDDGIQKWEIKEQIDANTRIVYQDNKLGFPLSNRDMVMIQGRFHEGDTYYLVFKSIDYSGAPATSDKVRATVTISAWIFAPAEAGKTKATRILHVDPAGNIPSMVVNSQAKKIYEFSAQLNSSLGV